MRQQAEALRTEYQRKLANARQAVLRLEGAIAGLDELLQRTGADLPSAPEPSKGEGE